jgi:hypothetical protein
MISFRSGSRRTRRRLERLASARVAPESLGAIAGALTACGLRGDLYRRAYEDLAAALPEDEMGMPHFIAYCCEAMRPFPLELSLDGLRRLFETRAPRLFKAKAAVALLNIHLAPYSPLWRGPIPRQAEFWSELLDILRSVGAPFLIIGDSHSNLYRRIVDGEGRLGIPVPILCSGCSAVGLANPRSRSGAGKRLAGLGAALAASGAGTNLPIFFKFGQVDAEFVFDFDRIRRGRFEFSSLEFRRFCMRSVESYVSFVADRFTAAQPCLIGLFPPALSDAAWRDGYVNAHVVATESDIDLDRVIEGLRRLEIPDLARRTRLHALYNHILRERARAASIGFLDDFSYFLGLDGVLDPRFVPCNRGADHHLEEAPTAAIIERLIDERLSTGA